MTVDLSFVAAIPEGALLLHVGPPKTGTTGLQGALHGGRATLEAHGVHYAGRDRQARTAAAHVAVGTSFGGSHARSARAWRRLLEEVATSSAPRVVVSAEMFANAPATQIPVIADALRAAGGRPLHVLVTLRPLVRILPSQYQQYVRAGAETTYEQWLHHLLVDPGPEGPDLFWRRHHHDRLVQRWGAVADGLTVVVVEGRPRDFPLRAVERLLDLPDGLLVPDERSNPSFSAPRTELVRRVNQGLSGSGVGPRRRRRLVRYGMVAHLAADPDPGPALVTPEWATAAAERIAAEAVAAIAAAPVQVVGDLAALTPGRPAGEVLPAHADVPDEVDLGTAAAAALRLLQAVGREPRPVPTTAEVSAVLGRLPARAYAGVVARSLRRQVARRLGR